MSIAHVSSDLTVAFGSGLADLQLDLKDHF